MSLSYQNIFKDVAGNLNSRINPYVAELVKAQESGNLPLLYGPKLEKRQGLWQEFFAERMQSKPKKLVVEIGCHLGKSLSEMAHRDLNSAFIGLDITFKRVVSSAKKLAALKNACVLLADARALAQLFAPQEIDVLVVFFPDPWMAKKRHRKNQLFSETFCKQLKTLLSPTGIVWVKTDQNEYFKDIIDLFAQEGFVRKDAPLELIDSGHLSSFEAFFKRQGIATNEAAFGLDQHVKLVSETVI